MPARARGGAVEVKALRVLVIAMAEAYKVGFVVSTEGDSDVLSLLEHLLKLRRVFDFPINAPHVVFHGISPIGLDLVP